MKGKWKSHEALAAWPRRVGEDIRRATYIDILAIPRIAEPKRLTGTMPSGPAMPGAVRFSQGRRCLKGCARAAHHGR
jgi:hypothetical protein